MRKYDFADDEDVKVDPEDWATLKRGRILRTNYPNKSVKQFATRHVFTTGSETLKWERGHGFRGILGEPTNESIDPFLERLTGIEGVIEVSCYPCCLGGGGGAYTLSVYKSAAFDWEELEPEIFKILVERDEMMVAQFGK